MRSYIKHFINLYTQTTLEFGATDICSSESPEPSAKAAAFGVVMCLARRGPSEGPLVREVVAILPPLRASTNLNEASILLSTVKASEAHFGRALMDDEKAVMSQRIKVIHTDDLRIASVLKALQSVGNQSAVIVMNAASYRDERIVPQSIKTLPRLSEDLWIPHFVQLARAVTEMAMKGSYYVLMDTGEMPPHKQENQEALKSVQNCGLFTVSSESDVSAIVATHSQEWQEQVKNGNIHSVFTSIDALPDWMNSQKPFLKLQLLERVAPGHAVMKLFRSEINTEEIVDPKARLKLARIAQRAGDEKIALEMLESAITGLNTQEDLEVALDTAAALSDEQTVIESSMRLEILFPESAELLKHRLAEFVDNRQYADILLLLDNKNIPHDPELTFCFRTLAAALQSSDTPKYEIALKAIEQAIPDHVNWARLICAREALARRDYITGINLCFSADKSLRTAGAARTLLRIIRELLLQRSEGGGLAITGEQLYEPISAVIQYLSVHPKDGETRMGLASLLSVEISGSLGLAVVIATTLRSAGVGVSVRANRKGQTSRRMETDLDILPFLRSASEWMGREGPIILEFAKLPRELLTAAPNELFSHLKQVINFDEADLRNENEADAFEELIFIGVLLAAHTSDPNEDLHILKYAAGRFIAANRLQKARDLAEQALAIAGDALERRRLAWLAFADIYHRVQNTIESLMGMACVFAIDVSIDFEQMWQEGYLLARIFRDLHFTDHAKSALNNLRGIIQYLEPRAKYEQRIMSLELGIRIYEVTRNAGYNAVQLQELTRNAEKHCSDLLAEGEEIAPAAALLAHCIYLFNLIGLTPNVDAVSTLKRALPKVSPSLAALIQTVTSNETGSQQLLTLAKSLEAARNSEDIAFDLTNIATAARRFLNTRSTDEAESVIFAIELLSDHAIKGSLIGTPESPVTTLGITAERAMEISLSGLRVIFLGRSESRRLVRVNVENGSCKEVVFEDDEMFSISKLEEWSQTFPYGYAQFRDSMNIFYTSTDGLGLTLSPGPASVLVMDNSLQQLPPNLIRIGSEFAGRTTPIASVPSLSWLWQAQKSVPRSNRRKAWISKEVSEDKNPALIMVADRLEECFKENQIDLDTAAQIPGDLKNLELAIIAAHGRLLPEGRFIQRLSDDAKLAVYPSALASAVNGSSMVILFICSGGRIDSHPTGETTVGLVKDLLNQGCSTVIASPWPLSVGVPPHWLPVFLEEWMAGKTAIEATYRANENVKTKLGDSPLDCLAMNVFGDPLRRKR